LARQISGVILKQRQECEGLEWLYELSMDEDRRSSSDWDAQLRRMEELLARGKRLQERIDSLVARAAKLTGAANSRQTGPQAAPPIGGEAGSQESGASD